MTRRLESRPTSPLVAHWPRLSRFYSISPFELQEWPHWLTRLYIESIPDLETEELSSAFTVADYPHLEQDDRERIHKAYFGDTAETVDASSEAGKKTLSDIGIAVVKG